MSGYCSVNDVRDVCNTRRTDSEIISLITIASERVNNDISIYVYKEYVTSISNVKLNSMDGSNTVFYTQNYPLGDYDNDFDVDADDVEAWVEDGDTETEYAVTSVDSALGKVTLTIAPPSGGILRLTYCHLPTHFTITHPLIKRATAYLTAFMCQSKVSAELAKSYSLDRLRVVYTADDVHIYLNNYNETIGRIRAGTGNVEVTGI